MSRLMEAGLRRHAILWLQRKGRGMRKARNSQERLKQGSQMPFSFVSKACWILMFMKMHVLAL